MSSRIAYADVEPRLNQWIAKSEDYLRRVLADNKPNKTRDWLESVEMLVESTRRPDPVPFKRRIARAIRVGAKKLRDWGVISDDNRADARRLGLLGIPLLQVKRENSLRHICLFGFRLKTIRR